MMPMWPSGPTPGGLSAFPSACCGTCGLKTTYGRVAVEGVWPLAPSLDTVGPMARTIEGVVTGMQLLEPGFVPGSSPAQRVGRLRTSGLPEIEAAVDAALEVAGLEVVRLDWDGLDSGTSYFTAIFFSELWEVDHALVEKNPDEVGEDIVTTMGMVDLFRPGLQDAVEKLSKWRTSLFALFDQVEILALPTLPIFPPSLDEVMGDGLVTTIIDITRHVSLFNAAGAPCTAQPVPVPGSGLPASLQLVGPMGGEELLLPTAALVEATVG